jgi:uncharacterized membrane protein
MEKGNFKLGVWAFMVGLLLAIIVALIGKANDTWPIIVLAILGILVGLLNVTAKEVEKFLVAAIAFLLSFNALSYVLDKIWADISVFFSLISVFMAAAAIVVAIKALYNLARD